LLPNPFLLDGETLIWSCGPMAKTVDDVFALLACMLGPHLSPWDRLAGRVARWRCKHPRYDEGQPLRWEDTVPPKRCNVRWTAHSELFETDPTVATAVERAAKRLGELGHNVEQMPALGGATPREFLPVWQRNSHTLPRVDLAQVEPFTIWLRQAKYSRSGAKQLVLDLRRRLLSRLGAADFWLTPTVLCSPPRIGEWQGLPAPELYDAASRLAIFTAPFNITGQPAISIPAGRDALGLPIGLQLIGRVGADLELLHLAKQLESAL
jgi:amidase